MAAEMDYFVEDFSDEDEPAISSGDDSSDSDIDQKLKMSVLSHHGKVNMKRLEKRLLLRDSEGGGDGAAAANEEGSEDEFESEMRLELDKRAREAECDGGIAEQRMDEDDVANTASGSGAAAAAAAATAASGASAKDGGDKADEKPDFYDDVYFDSDDEAEDKEKKRSFKTDAELFYDPEQDDRDQKWVDDVRRSYLPQQKKSTASAPEKVRPLPNSDAVLNCPACFVCVCMDCQRHETFTNQYRAMFVLNCSVDLTQRLKFPTSKDKKRSKKKKKGRWTSAVAAHSAADDDGGSSSAAAGSSSAAAGSSSAAAGSSSAAAAAPADDDDEQYNPVRCDQCKAEIGMFDKDEIYHFFNVIASH